MWNTKNKYRNFFSLSVDMSNGNGELMAFVLICLIVSTLYVFIVAFFQYSQSLHSLTRALIPTGRTVAISETRDMAMHDGMEVAIASITDPRLDNVQLELEKVGEQHYVNEEAYREHAHLADNENESADWRRGNYYKVTLNANVRTIEPFILSGNVKKSIIVTLEYQSDEFLAGYSIVSADNLAPAMEQYRGLIRQYCAQYGIPEYEDVMMAIGSEESGGLGTDILASSESAGLDAGAFSSQERSIQQGCYAFSQALAMGQRAGVDLPTVIQSYNFGGAFINYVSANYGGQYSLQAAMNFAAQYSGGVVTGYNNEVSRELGMPWRYKWGNFHYVPVIYHRHFGVPLSEFK